jgi:anti-anti-sigma factor
MALRTEKVGDVVVVLPEGRLWGDKETTQLESELRRLMQANQKKILLDLRHVSAMNSVAIGVLAGVHASAASRNLAFFVCNIERRIHNVLTILKLINVLHVYDTREEALEALARL